MMMSKIVGILFVMFGLCLSVEARDTIQIEPADARVLRELGVVVRVDDLQNTGKMQLALRDGFSALGVDYDVEGAVLLYCPRTWRIFFTHPDKALEEKTRKLLRAATVMAWTA